MHHTTAFLEHVARDLHRRHGDDLSQLTIVFPNKRASLFLNEHLASLSDRPLWCPRHTTISELFRSHSPLSVADDILLICELWRSFTSCTGSTETLDHFYGWGGVLLSDFDDIDKSMANAQGVFANLGDLHAYDTADFLSDHQREVLRHFFRDFGDDHTSLLRKKFLQLWSRFGDIYTDYRRRLRDRGLAYEGALYREVVEDEGCDFGSGTYVFVGFNALQEVERRLFRRLKESGQALFYWDFDHYYLPMGLAFIIYGFYRCKVYKVNDTFLWAVILFFGGIGQATAGFLEWCKGRAFPTAIYLTYGFYCLSHYALYIIPPWFVINYNQSMLYNFGENSLCAFYSGWVVISFAILLASIRTNCLYIFQCMAAFTFFLLRAVGEGSGSLGTKRNAAGILQAISGFFSLLVCFSQLLNNETFFSPVFPTCPMSPYNDIDLINPLPAVAAPATVPVV